MTSSLPYCRTFKTFDAACSRSDRLLCFIAWMNRRTLLLFFRDHPIESPSDKDATFVNPQQCRLQRPKFLALHRAILGGNHGLILCREDLLSDPRKHRVEVSVILCKVTSRGEKVVSFVFTLWSHDVKVQHAPSQLARCARGHRAISKGHDARRAPFNLRPRVHLTYHVAHRAHQRCGFFVHAIPPNSDFTFVLGHFGFSAGKCATAQSGRMKKVRMGEVHDVVGPQLIVSFAGDVALTECRIGCCIYKSERREQMTTCFARIAHPNPQRSECLLDWVGFHRVSAR